MSDKNEITITVPLCCDTLYGFYKDEIMIYHEEKKPWKWREWRISIPKRVIRDTSGQTKPMFEFVCRDLGINFCPWCGYNWQKFFNE
jgi:hypothetical protein